MIKDNLFEELKKFIKVINTHVAFESNFVLLVQEKKRKTSIVHNNDGGSVVIEAL